MEVLPGVHVLADSLWSRMYLIEGDRLALVDSGLRWNPRTVLRYIESLGRKPEELDLVLATHSHPDHTSGAQAIRRHTGAEVVAHAYDTRKHSDHQVSLSYMRVFTSLRVPLPFLRYTPVDRVVADGDVLDVLGGIAGWYKSHPHPRTHTWECMLPAGRERSAILGRHLV